MQLVIPGKIQTGLEDMEFPGVIKNRIWKFYERIKKEGELLPAQGGDQELELEIYISTYIF